MNRISKSLRIAGRGLKRLTMRFSGRMVSWYSLARGTRFDYAAAVGDGSGNSAVMACLLWAMRAFPEAPIRVSRRQGDGTLKPQPDHGMAQLIDAPNPFYDGALLWMATKEDYDATGNAYWLKVRSGAGRVVQLWWAPSWMMAPHWPDTGAEYISHYEYKPGTTQPIRVEPADVVHFRFGLDPRNPRKGLSPLAAAVREVFGDDEAGNWAAALLRNGAVPGVVISPDDEGGSIDQGDADAIKGEFQSRFGGDNRGSVMVMPAKTKVSVLSFSPEQMALRDLRRLPEERISALLGVPAIVAGLGAGLDRSTFANYAEAREAAYEGNIIPTQRVFAGVLRRQLLPDFVGEDVSGWVVDFDTSQVRVLQEDQNSLWSRAARAARNGIITVGEARSMVGLSSGPEHDFYLRPSSAQPIPASDPLAMPAQSAPGGADTAPPPAVDESAAPDKALAVTAHRNGHTPESVQGA